MSGFPEIEVIGNTQPKDREEATQERAAFWHTEHAYEADPISSLMFYPIKVPRVGGETWIADMRSAYDDLDEEVKTRIDGLIVKHDYLEAQGGDGETNASPIKTAEQAARVPPVRHYLAPPTPRHAVGNLSTPSPVSSTASKGWKTKKRWHCWRT